MRHRTIPLLTLLCTSCFDPERTDDACSPDAERIESPTRVELRPAFRGAVNLGLAEGHDLIHKTGENPTVSTWDGKVVIRRCPDPDSTEEAEPGVVIGQFWCFHAFRPGRVTLDDGGAPQFGDAFGAGFRSEARHVSHTGGFPVVENPVALGAINPYPSGRDGNPCGVGSREAEPPPCGPDSYATYDLFIVHTADPSNPTLTTDYPDWQPAEGNPTYFVPMHVVVQDPQTDAARVVDVIPNGDPRPMIADPTGFGFVYEREDDNVRNPYLYRREGDPTTYIGGVAMIEPAATNDGRMVIFNGGDENPYGVNLVYSWNPNPAASTGWSPPKNVAYMHWVEGPGAPGGETMIEVDGVARPFSDVFPIARAPLRNQEGVVYDPGSTYKPARRNAEGAYEFEVPLGGGPQYLGSYPWISWDGRNIMSLAVGRFNVAVIGEVTGYGAVWLDGAIDRTDSHLEDNHEIVAMWNLGQWPGRWAQYAVEYEGRERTIPTRLRDAPTWAIFEQDHYSEVSFHKTDGSYAAYYTMSRVKDGTHQPYKEGKTPDVSRQFNTGTFVANGGRVDFSQGFTGDSDVFGWSGNSIGFETDSSVASVDPHIQADRLEGLEDALTVEGAIHRSSADSWSTLVRQPGAFALGVDAKGKAWFEVTDADGTTVRAVSEEAVAVADWVHLTGVYDADAVTVFVDGQAVATEQGTAEPVGEAEGDLAIGPRNHDGESGGHGVVYLDEVGVTPAVRSQEDIVHSAYQRQGQPALEPAVWSEAWEGNELPLGLADPSGRPLAPMYLGFEPQGDLAAKIRLGERLFSDPALSTTDPPISCASCHALDGEHHGARRGEDISSAGAGALSRHTPTVFNRVFGTRQFWDGRASSLAEQALLPIESEAEMDLPLCELTERVLPQEGYAADFEAAFGSPETTPQRVQEAIALFESGLVAADSDVDRFRHLGEPMPDAAVRGLALFSTKARCIGCHPPPLYTDERFHDNDQGNDDDEGRAAATGLPSDHGLFRTMSLRDAARTPPYMHDGTVRDLETVIAQYNDGGPAQRPLGLTDAERADLLAFLESLSSR